MSVKHVGLVEILKAKMVLGLPVSAEDVTKLAEIVNHNAYEQNELRTRLTKLEATVKEMFELSVHSFKAIDQNFNSMANVSEKLTESVENVATRIEGLEGEIDEIDEDIDNLVDDLNGEAGESVISDREGTVEEQLAEDAAVEQATNEELHGQELPTEIQALVEDLASQGFEVVAFPFSDEAALEELLNDKELGDVMSQLECNCAT